MIHVASENDSFRYNRFLAFMSPKQFLMHKLMVFSLVWYMIWVCISIVYLSYVERRNGYRRFISICWLNDFG